MADLHVLAIVIDSATHKRWEVFKQQTGLNRDRSAFVLLLERATTAGLFPPDQNEEQPDDPRS